MISLVRAVGWLVLDPRGLVGRRLAAQVQDLVEELGMG